MKRYPVVALFATLTLALPLSSVAVAQLTPGPVRADQRVMSGQIVKKVPPQYPSVARQARIQGTVVLKAVIDTSGAVQSLQLISGHPMLAPAVIEAVKQWKYTPYLLNGDPVVVETNVTVNFNLVGNVPEEGVGVVGHAESGLIGSAPANGAVPLRARVSQGVEQALIVSKVQPEYPDDAKAQRIQGAVQLKAIIDRDGNVANLQLISGDPVLAPAAIEAVKQWKYRPYLFNGNPIEVETTVTVNFTLAD